MGKKKKKTLGFPKLTRWHPAKGFAASFRLFYIIILNILRINTYAPHHFCPRKAVLTIPKMSAFGVIDPTKLRPYWLVLLLLCCLLNKI